MFVNVREHSKNCTKVSYPVILPLTRLFYFLNILYLKSRNNTKYSLTVLNLVLLHLQMELEQNWQKSDFRRYKVINILKFSKAEALLLEPMICIVPYNFSNNSLK